MKKRVQRSDKEKAKIALHALRNEETQSELAKRYSIHATQVGKWRKQLETEAYRVFAKDKVKSMSLEEHEKELRPLYEQIGRLQVENDYLKKKIT